MNILSREKIIGRLKEAHHEKNRELFIEADEIRKKHVGDQVHLRGLLEFSNICRKKCTYCGINCYNTTLPRYVMSPEEILEAAGNVVKAGFGTIVLQSGEGALSPGEIEDIILSIKSKFDLAVTLSAGEHPSKVYEMWKKAGADRYLLKIETGMEHLYARIHPDSPLKDRIEMLKNLKNLGYETGTGIMVGLPCQTFESIADDLLLMRELDIDMIGTGPFIPHPDTPLGKELLEGKSTIVPNTMEMALKVVAMTRILMPDINIPSTTAIATVHQEGRKSALNAGANIIMPNMTPAKYRKFYEIYPSKNPEFSNEDPEAIKEKVTNYLKSLGRQAGTGQGGRKRTVR